MTAKVDQGKIGEAAQALMNDQAAGPDKMIQMMKKQESSNKDLKAIINGEDKNR